MQVRGEQGQGDFPARFRAAEERGAGGGFAPSQGVKQGKGWGWERSRGWGSEDECATAPAAHRASQIELGAREEHPGEVKTLEWLLLWQENKPVSAQSQLGKGWEPAWMGMLCWKAKSNSFWTNLLTKGIKQGQSEVLRECFHPEQGIFYGSDLV